VYRDETLDNFFILFFVIVPIWALATVLYHVLWRNGAFRVVFFWVDFSKYDEAVSHISTRRKTFKSPEEEEKEKEEDEEVGSILYPGKNHILYQPYND
jgi:hypothetical protein